jgi:DNA invertase Pin-like site-specific DNA recombinase
MTSYVSYCRVSSEEQSRSGLGLESQIQIIIRFIEGEKSKLIHSFTEVCSGSDKRGIRPIFREAVEYCRKNNYTLIVSKIDRFGRSFKSLVFLKESGIKFISVDNPSNSNLVLNIMMSIAEEERMLISQRTKNALHVKKQQLKKEGKSLGNPNLNEVRHLAHQARRDSVKLDHVRNEKTNIVMEIFKDSNSYRICSDKLNRLKIYQPNGKTFTQQQVRRYILRYQKLHS